MSDFQDRKACSGGLEALLLQAARDPVFHSDLRQRRAAAAADKGIELTPSERAMLAAIPPQQLDAAVVGLRGRAASQPSLPEHVELTAGIRPDVVRGSRPAGIRPDVVRGSRPAIAVAAAGGIAVVAAAGAYGLTLGHTADLPPERSTLDAAGGAGQARPAPAGSAREQHDAGAPDAQVQDRDAAPDAAAGRE